MGLQFLRACARRHAFVVCFSVQTQQSLSASYGPPAPPPSALSASSGDCYLGVICPALCLSRDYLFYAYVCTTGIKILVAIEQRNHYHQHDVRNVSKSVFSD